mmetsp:Transcript_6513/g.14212  ORF Transcript_6513/g.14212 Transcript_6513/m.14212 type:complete len:245 (+) Transcript_6513:1014-1748(+)
MVIKQTHAGSRARAPSRCSVCICTSSAIRSSSSSAGRCTLEFWSEGLIGVCSACGCGCIGGGGVNRRGASRVAVAVASVVRPPTGLPPISLPPTGWLSSPPVGPVAPIDNEDCPPTGLPVGVAAPTSALASFSCRSSSSSSPESSLEAVPLPSLVFLPRRPALVIERRGGLSRVSSGANARTPSSHGWKRMRKRWFACADDSARRRSSNEARPSISIAGCAGPPYLPMSGVLSPGRRRNGEPSS